MMIRRIDFRKMMLANGERMHVSKNEGQIREMFGGGDAHCSRIRKDGL